MIKLLSAICALTLLASCTAAPPSAPPPDVIVELPPSEGPIATAPVRATNVDERALKLTFDAFDALLTAVDLLIASDVIVPGSPMAQKVKQGVFTTRTALNAAAAAQRAANAESYAAAIDDARAAIRQTTELLNGVRP